MEAHGVKKIVRAEWERAILVCGKCSSKIDGGFGAKGRTPLAKSLRKELGLGKGRRARMGVAEIKCLGVCPKRAVVAVDGFVSIVGIGGGLLPAGFFSTPFGVSVRAPYWGSRSELREVLDLARVGAVTVHTAAKITKRATRFIQTSAPITTPSVP